MEPNTQNKKLNKKDLQGVFLRSLTIMGSWNYERQMNMGYMYGMSSVLDKLYADDPEGKKTAYNRHMEFFNCTPQMASFLMGITSSMEEQYVNDKDNFDPHSISLLKTTLMGPLSGIGDSFFQGTLRVITFGIGLAFAQQGSVLGPILAVVLFAIPSLFLAYKGTMLGYEGGNKYLTKISDEGLMDRVMDGANRIGLMVVGAMIASMINITTPLEFNTGGVELNVQEMLDSIFPNLIPLIVTLILYSRVKDTKNVTRLLFITIIAGIILSLIGIL